MKHQWSNQWWRIEINPHSQWVTDKNFSGSEIENMARITNSIAGVVNEVWIPGVLLIRYRHVDGGRVVYVHPDYLTHAGD